MQGRFIRNQEKVCFLGVPEPALGPSSLGGVKTRVYRCPACKVQNITAKIRVVEWEGLLCFFRMKKIRSWPRGRRETPKLETMERGHR